MKKILIKRLIIFILIIFFILSCRYDRVYHNRAYRYKIKYPEAWVAINSGHDIKAEAKFKERLMIESIVSNYESVDAAFYNPNSYPPIFESITIRAEQTRFNVKNLNEQIPYLTDIYTVQLAGKFYNVRNIRAEMLNFKKGKIFRFDFIYEYDEIEYLSSYFIIPGRLYATYFISATCQFKNEIEFSSILNKVLNSFHKY